MRCYACDQLMTRSDQLIDDEFCQRCFDSYRQAKLENMPEDDHDD